MTLKIQIIILIIVFVGFIYIINLIKKRKLELQHALPWFCVGILLLVFTYMPSLITKLADFIGIVTPANMIFFLGFLFALVLILTLTVTLSNAINNINRLIQQISILEKRITELEDKAKGAK